MSAPDSLGLSARYNLSANLHWADRRLVVVSTAHVINTTPSAVTALTFNLVPAKIGQIALNGVTVNGSAASTSLDDMNLIVHLYSGLAPNDSADVTIRYSANFNSTNPNRRWLFAERHDIVTAYRWIPWLSQPASLTRTGTFGSGRRQVATALLLQGNKMGLWRVARGPFHA